MKNTPTERDDRMTPARDARATSTRDARASAAREAVAVRTLRKKVKEANELLRLGMTRSAERLHDLFKDLAACAACWIDGGEEEQSLALAAMGDAGRETDTARRRDTGGTAVRCAAHHSPRLVLHPAIDTGGALQRCDDSPRNDVNASTAAGDAVVLTRLTCAALSSGGGEPRGEWLLIPFGDVRIERPLVGDGSFEFTRRHAESALRWFESLGRKLAIDYEHQMFADASPRADGLRPAAGWIGGLEIRADGLWAVDVVWTDRAAQLIRGGEYRYFSPVIFWTDEDRADLAALGPVALTNDPAMHGVPALAAGRESARRGGSRSETAEAGFESETRTSDGAARMREGIPALQAPSSVAFRVRERILAPAAAAAARGSGEIESESALSIRDEVGEVTYPRLIPIVDDASADDEPADDVSADDAGESETEVAARVAAETVGDDPSDLRASPGRLAASRGKGAAIESYDEFRHDAATRDERGGEEPVPARLLEDLRTEVSMLSRRMAAQQADAFVERGMREGKILDANSLDWRDDFLRDPAEAEDRLSRAPVLLPPGRIIRLDARGAPAGEIASATGRGQASLMSREHGGAALRGGTERHGVAAVHADIEVEDLEAYERARVAGRVV